MKKRVMYFFVSVVGVLMLASLIACGMESEDPLATNVNPHEENISEDMQEDSDVEITPGEIEEDEENDIESTGSENIPADYREIGINTVEEFNDFVREHYHIYRPYELGEDGEIIPFVGENATGDSLTQSALFQPPAQVVEIDKTLADPSSEEVVFQIRPGEPGDHTFGSLVHNIHYAVEGTAFRVSYTYPLDSDGWIQVSVHTYGPESDMIRDSVTLRPKTIYFTYDELLEASLSAESGELWYEHEGFFFNMFIAPR